VGAETVAETVAENSAIYLTVSLLTEPHSILHLPYQPSVSVRAQLKHPRLAIVINCLRKTLKKQRT